MPSGPVNLNLHPDAPATDGPGIDYAEGEFLGFRVHAKRVRGEHWCGYLTVPAQHPWVKASLNDAGKPDEWLVRVDVHGGCTYAEMVDDGLTVGFDCAHGCDGLPPWCRRGTYGLYCGPCDGGWMLGCATTEGYRDLEYVRQELLGLARQAADAAAAGVAAWSLPAS